MNRVSADIDDHPDQADRAAKPISVSNSRSNICRSTKGGTAPADGGGHTSRSNTFRMGGGGSDKGATGPANAVKFDTSRSN